MLVCFAVWFSGAMFFSVVLEPLALFNVFSSGSGYALFQFNVAICHHENILNGCRQCWGFGSPEPDLDSHVFGPPDPLARGTDPDPSLFS
jgi:hypothetical protein